MKCSHFIEVTQDPGYLRVFSYVKSTMKMFILRDQEKLILGEFIGWNLFLGLVFGLDGVEMKAKTRRISNLHPQHSIKQWNKTF